MNRIYLDNAATSWPKPPEVYDAIDRFNRENGAAAGRGVSTAAEQSGAIIQGVRRGIASLIGGEEPKRVILTPGGTEALNLAIQGIVRPGDHVVTTVAEHNSVLRPLAWLRDHAGVRLTHVGCDQDGYVSPEDVDAAIGPETRLVAVTHASNVTGALQPIEAIGQRCRARGVRLLVDAAQTVGAVPINVAGASIDLLAAPGHKHLLGPLGTGFLWIGRGVEAELQPLMQGGTGSASESDLQPETLPERYESGNLNTPALAGLLAALNAAQQPTAKAPPLDSAATLLEGLSSIDGVTLLGPPADAPRVEVVSLLMRGYDPHSAAAVLATQGVESRAGLHCAGRMHDALGTLAGGGALRFSPGWATTPDEISATLAIVEAMIAATPKH